ncbi:hypothetical protein CANINC_003857 [Pichia inconspicua]|uniref:SAGA complex subunit Spt7 n=1 Tax=Pichia inconspicua TaxID=52247 RepID=A0A4T0WXJ2_9ASCO|nr:hypothetical protein CANINC_003857 [[Candida] inconspicua]
MQSVNRKRVLQLFRESDEVKLWHIAIELLRSGFFNCYLTPQQFNALETILNIQPETEGNNLVWKSFLQGILILKFKEDNGDDSNSNDNMYMKPGYSSLRNLNATLRYLLYEKVIDYIYFENDRNDSHDFHFVEDLFFANNDVQEKLASSNQKAIERPVAIDEDDDYDDEEDEIHNDKGDSENKYQSGQITVNAVVRSCPSLLSDKIQMIQIDDVTHHPILVVSKEDLLKKPNYPKVEESTQEDEEIGKLVHPILSTTSAIESSIEKRNEIKLIKKFNKTIHSFENDLPNLLKRRKLERSNKEVEESSEAQPQDLDANTNTKAVNTLISLGGAVNLSLKNLLHKIETNRDKLGVTDVELKNLIMDVRKNRSKWANYNRIGQEELYEACEKVVNELRSYTEHSTPFLNRVSKREAPNYYQVIKTPMDLNTVLKKLKTLQYQNKKAFVDDIMLIWQNCLTYNSDPKHYLRVDAIAMRKKSLELLPLIPDITIRDRIEVEREAAELERNEKEKEETETVGRTSARGMSSTTRKSRKGVVESKNLSSETKLKLDPDASTAAASDVDDLSPKLNMSMEIDTNESDAQEVEKKPDQHKSKTYDDLDDEEDNEEDNEINNLMNHDEPDEDANEDNDDLEVSTWRTLTSNTRYKLCKERSKLFKENKLQPDAEALLRTKRQMNSFEWHLKDETNLILHKNRNGLDENDDPYLIEYDVTGGVPEICHNNLNIDQVEENILERMIEKGQKLEDLPDSRVKVKVQGCNSMILENISLMQDIRKICFRINLIRSMQTSKFMHQSQYVAPSKPKIKFDDIDPMSKLSTRDLMSENIAYHALLKSVSALTMLNGFEQTSKSCAVLLTEVAKNYISNLAKTFKLLLESKSINKLQCEGNKPLTCKEFLQIVLCYNGIENPDSIYAYYKEQITKQHKKLMDLKFGLENFLCDLLRPSMQDLSESQFNDDSEQFVNGDFSDELGEDFFGFKELGLDKEFGLLTSNIPLHLLQSKLSHQFNQMNKNMAKRVYPEFGQLSFSKLKKKDIPNQLGILRPFYEDLLEKSKSIYTKQLRRYQTQIANGEVPEEPFQELEDEEELVLVEDEDLPLKQRNNRPKIPPNGKITQGKKKTVTNTFDIEKQEELRRRMEEILSKKNLDTMSMNLDGNNNSETHMLSNEKSFSNDENDHTDTDKIIDTTETMNLKDVAV